MIPQDIVEPLLARHPERAVAVATADAGNVVTQLVGTDEPRPFAVGSVSKLFTALLLADCCGRGEAGLDTRLEEVVPDLTRANPDVAAITLCDLASHCSGLPRESVILASRYDAGQLDDEDPYSDFTKVDLVDSLARTGCAEAPGTYSNFGFQTLALVLEQVTGQTYSQLLAERVCRPLGLTATVWHADR